MKLITSKFLFACLLLSALSFGSAEAQTRFGVRGGFYVATVGLLWGL